MLKVIYIMFKPVYVIPKVNHIILKPVYLIPKVDYVICSEFYLINKILNYRETNIFKRMDF